MIEPISQKRIIICGTNGTGKSTFAEKLINSILSVPNKKCLALLPDDGEKIFYSYNEIQRHQLKNIG